MCAATIRAKHPDRIPVIVDRRVGDSSLPEIDKKKFLVPSDLTIGQLMYVIRKRIKLAPEQAIFLFVATGTLPPSGATLQAVYVRALGVSKAFARAPSCLRMYTTPTDNPCRLSRAALRQDQHANEDGFLYMTYSGENFFGGR